MAAEHGFTIVSEDHEPPQNRQPETPKTDPVAIKMLMLSLKALSERALVAIDNLFTLITVGLVFWLWKLVPEPSYNQIIGLAIFALFVLAANVIVRRK